MKKIVIGIIIGVGLTLGTSIFADNIKSLIGAKVDATFPVTIEGKKVSEDAVLINGHTYLQLRTMGDALNYDVSFDADLGVKLKKRVGATSTMSINSTPETVQQIQARHDAQDIADKLAINNETKRRELTEKINKNQELIKINQEKISKQQDTIAHLKDRSSDPNAIDPTIFNDQLKTYQDENNTLQAEIVTAQSQLDSINGGTPSPSPTP